MEIKKELQEKSKTFFEILKYETESEKSEILKKARIFWQTVEKKIETEKLNQKNLYKKI